MSHILFTPLDPADPDFSLRDCDDQARSLIPNGCQTYSKAPERFVRGCYPAAIESADGCFVIGSDNKCYMDFIAGLGPIILGYRHPTVNRFVYNAVLRSEVLYSLPHRREVDLARWFANNIPGAQMSKFFKTGSEALSAAVRVARASTGKTKIASCGYHGWHDWYCASTKRNAGVPKELAGTIVSFKYNDLESLRECFKSADIAAIVMEPIIYEQPNEGYLQQVIDMAHAHEALVIFDEVVTGFRFPGFSASSFFGVRPDLSCFSKAMGNGYSIAALAGLSEYMRVFERPDFFVSGTFGGDLIGINAALGVIEAFKKGNQPLRGIWERGAHFKKDIEGLLIGAGLGEVTIEGYPSRTRFAFPSIAHKALFWQECLYGGLLLGNANFIMATHTAANLKNAVGIIESALTKVKAHWKEPMGHIRGMLPTEVF